jgi:hypothetical protein
MVLLRKVLRSFCTNSENTKMLLETIKFMLLVQGYYRFFIFYDMDVLLKYPLRKKNQSF